MLNVAIRKIKTNNFRLGRNFRVTPQCPVAESTLGNVVLGKGFKTQEELLPSAVLSCLLKPDSLQENVVVLVTCEV